jgi:small redox-active disulfide protein 2
MIIKVLGMDGCANCQNLKENTQKAVSELNLKAEVQKVDDITEVMSYGVMAMPGLVVDDKVVLSGKVADVEEIKALLGKKKK